MHLQSTFYFSLKARVVPTRNYFRYCYLSNFFSRSLRGKNQIQRPKWQRKSCGWQYGRDSWYYDDIGFSAEQSLKVIVMTWVTSIKETWHDWKRLTLLRGSLGDLAMNSVMETTLILISWLRHAWYRERISFWWYSHEKSCNLKVRLPA